VFAPTVKLIAPEALPLVTAVPLTVIVALISDLVGVTVMLVVALLTTAVYDVVEPTTAVFNVPTLNVKADKSAFNDNVLNNPKLPVVAIAGVILPKTVLSATLYL